VIISTYVPLQLNVCNIRLIKVHSDQFYLCALTVQSL